MRYSKPVVGSSVDSTVHFTVGTKTQVSQIVHINPDQKARIHQLFQLADFQLVYAAPVGAIREQFRGIVKAAEANIREIGRVGGERFQNVKSDLEFANVLNDDDCPNKRPPANLLLAVDSILHG